MTQSKGEAMSIHAYAAKGAKQALESFEFDPGPLGDHEVEVAVTHCGICHSDVSMIDNDWGMAAFPLIPGHEVVGTVAAMGQLRMVRPRQGPSLHEAAGHDRLPSRRLCGPRPRRRALRPAHPGRALLCGGRAAHVRRRDRL
jgi:hypothetical protein